MSALDVEALLAPVSAEAPCGENLEYDADYVIMEQAAVGKPEQQFGATVIPAEEPNWREMQSQALALLPKSKDLRVAVYLTRAAVRTSGLAGLADGLEVLSGFIERYWDGVHPQLDPDDNDPTQRVNSLASLTGAQETLKGIRDATLVASRAMGKFSYRDVLIASGEMPPPTGTAPVEQSSIDGAFADAEPNELKATGKSLERALGMARQLESGFSDRVGAGSGPELKPLIDLIAAISKLVNQKLAQRGLLDDGQPAEAAHSGAEEKSEISAPSDGAASNGRKAGAAAPLTGDIASREDVIRALDKICDYYKRYEPSSPVPLFLNRAKRLASKSFLEILRDLTPDAVNQALAIGGISDGAEASSAAPNDL